VRHYHTLIHLGEIFARLDGRYTSLQQPRQLAFATFFHDSIYEPTAKDNELRSAQLWREFAAEAALPPADIEPVAAWIERTAKHMDGAATGDLAHFLDADLGVLGKPPATYAAYARQIRLEYCHVSPAVFPAARAQAMEGFLKAERLYFTDEAHAQFEANARHNVASEIRRLRADAP